MSGPDFESLRKKMVSEQISGRGIENFQVLEAFARVQRHLFVPVTRRKAAYADSPLPIGQGQTISQPYMVALMTQVLDLKPGMRVLEIGTGSGYQAAILCFLGAQVYTIERISSLAERAEEVLNTLGHKVQIKVGDGTLGWAEFSPYDRIIVTARAAHIPQAFIDQVKVGGKIIIPLGPRFHQDLKVISKISENKVEEESVCGCVFVPLIGKDGCKE